MAKAASKNQPDGKGHRSASSGTSPEVEAGTKPVSQKQAVRDALAELGQNAKPTEIDRWLRAKYGLVLARHRIGIAKAQIKAQVRAKEEREQRGLNLSGEGLRFQQDMTLLLELVQRLGPDRIRKFLDLFEK